MVVCQSRRVHTCFETCWCLVQAHGIVGNEGSTPIEVEQAPAVSLTLANIEGAEVTSFTVTGERLPDAGASSPRQSQSITAFLYLCFCMDG